MEILKFTSCQAEIAEFIGQEMAAYTAERLSMPTAFINNIAWQTREQMFDADEIQVAWICGVPYVWKADRAAAIELLAAPVMAAKRYQGQPVYYSDIVVHSASRFQTFADLRNASWAYNEPHSHSGYHTVRFHLAQIDERSNYFGTVLESGAHQTTLQWLVDRQIDASAVDSTVLELAYERDPTLHQHLRVIGTLGPSPIPPWVIRRSVPLEMRHALRQLLLHMHEDPIGQAILARSQMACFVAVTDQDYDPIRQMLRAADGITL